MNLGMPHQRLGLRLADPGLLKALGLPRDPGSLVITCASSTPPHNGRPLSRAFDASGRSQVAHALETAVAKELERRGAEIGHVKTGAGEEVDFLARRPDAGAELPDEAPRLFLPDSVPFQAVQTEHNLADGCKFDKLADKKHARVARRRWTENGSRLSGNGFA